MNQIKFHLIPLCLLAFLFSCKKDKSENPDQASGTNEVATGTLDLGTKISSDFTGQIVDENGTPVSGVAISVGGKTASTDNSGFFYVEDALVYNKLAYVKADKAGYFPGSRSVIPSSTSLNGIKITLLSKDIDGSVVPGIPMTISESSGAAVDFKGEYVDANGNPYNGAVDVSIKYLPALASETADQMPGMLYAENDNGESGALVTYGMLAVELIGESGQEINIASGSAATIHVPVDQAQLSDAPSTIPLWHFDEVAGYWVEEGSAELINGEYVGQVGHFSFWNCDVFYDDCAFNGQVNNHNGDGLPLADVAINTGNNSTVGTVNPDGSFFTYLPANTNIEMTASYGCSGVISQTYNFGPYASSSVNSETLIINTSSLNAITVSGTIVDCNNAPVNSGNVVIDAGLGYVYEPIVNGVVNFTVESCQAIQQVNVYATTSNGFTNQMQYSVVSGAVNLGQIQICNGSTSPAVISNAPEYFQITMDAGQPQLYETDVNFGYGDSISGTGFIVGIQELPDFYVISDLINSVGTYVSDNFSQNNFIIFWDFQNMDMNAPYFAFVDITEYGGSGGNMVLSLVGHYSDTLGNPHDVEVQLKVIIP